MQSEKQDPERNRSVPEPQRRRDTKRAPGVVRALSLRLFLASASAFLVFYAYWGYDVYRTMQAEATYRADTLLEERRAYIRALVETAVNGAEQQRRTIEARARRVIRERGRRALRQVQYIWENRAPDDTRADILERVRETLRPQRFDGGRGYYFAFDIETGEGILHADKPSLEGQDLRSVADPNGRLIVASIIESLKREGEGFYAYSWAHPNQPGRNHPKIAYGVLFEPLNLGIAIGDYIEDIAADVKAETLARIEALRFGRDGYIFAGTWDGISLIEPAKGRNMWSVTDPNGVKIVQELVAAARAGGGFVRYVRPDLGEGFSVSERISYVLPVPEWKWYIGAGVSIDDINETIAAMRAETREDALRNLLVGGILVIVLAAASYLIALRSARGIGRDISHLETFLSEDGRAPDGLDPDRLHHREFRRLAKAIRGMANRRDAAEHALERQTRNLERSNAELERFAYVASHDLREPLRIVASYAGLLQRRYQGRLEGDADTFIRFIIDGAQRMHDMIGDLLEYSRVKRVDSPMEPVALGGICDRAVANLAASIKETGAEVHVAPALPVVKGRAPLLVSLFQNLLENAIKYRHPDRQPMVRIKGGIQDGEALVRISDNGLGIDPAFHDRIFQIFQRLHPSHVYPGTGVGLSLCQSICESHGGRIWLESKPGEGTTFLVTLALADPDPAAAVASSDGPTDGAERTAGPVRAGAPSPSHPSGS
jgi:signal transduction histidine kinase